MYGKPAGVNLLERFLLSSLAATTVLRDRMRTRFVQGIGRCCRGESDYAAVLIAGPQLYEFCLDRKVTSAISTELQAEIEFGLAESKDDGITVDKLLSHIQLLMEQGDDWDKVEDHLENESKELQKEEDPASTLLMSTVKNEVRYQYELIKKNYEKAGELAIKVASDLNSDKKLDGYRSWWLYLAATALSLAEVESRKPELRDKVNNLLDQASSCSNSVAWFSEIKQALSKTQMSESIINDMDIVSKKQCEEALRNLRKLGLYDNKFENQMTEITEQLNQSNSKEFEKGLESLGKYLGFRSNRYDETAAPDGIWTIGNHYGIIFEAKSDESEDGAISVQTVRQALSHESWTASKLQIEAESTDFKTVVVSPRKTIDEKAMAILKGQPDPEVFYFHIRDIRTLATKVQTALRVIRTQLAHDEELGIELIYKTFAEEKLLAKELRELLTKSKLESLKQPAIRLTKK